MILSSDLIHFMTLEYSFIEHGSHSNFKRHKFWTSHFKTQSNRLAVTFKIQELRIAVPHKFFDTIVRIEKFVIKLYPYLKFKTFN